MAFFTYHSKDITINNDMLVIRVTDASSEGDSSTGEGITHVRIGDNLDDSIVDGVINIKGPDALRAEMIERARCNDAGEYPNADKFVNVAAFSVDINNRRDRASWFMAMEQSTTR